MTLIIVLNEGDQEDYRDMTGHIKYIHRATKREVKARSEKFLLSLPLLKKLSKADPHYRDLHQMWVDNNYHDYYNPILTKPKFKLSYSATNYAWIPEGTVNQIKHPHADEKSTPEQEQWAEEEVKSYRAKLRAKKESKGKK